ncbi:MAG: hypothetical protein Q4B03_06645 [Lachnospiraceae bacterium]|nr:hypothetical protein [Lachnospiraceae bacterium]
MLKITFVNSGYAEGILIQCPDDSRQSSTFVMTIDGGGARPDEFEGNISGRIRMSDYLKQTEVDHIDLMVSTHTHEDHICGQKLCAELLPPRELWQTLPPGLFQTFEQLDVFRGTNLSQVNFLSALNDYIHLCNITEENGGLVRQISAGTVFSINEDLTIKVLAPNDEKEKTLTGMMQELYSSVDSDDFLEKLNGVDSKLNNFSLILMLEYRGQRVLLPGDTNRYGYDDLQDDDLHADLFKVGHHGQIDGASETVIRKVQPSMVVCCASSDRRYNSAHPDLISMIEKTGAKMYYSDCPVEGIPAHKAVQFSVSDEGIWSAEYIR